MKKIASLLIALTLSLAAATAIALPGTFEIEQIYSNADGTVQFVVIHDRGQNDCDARENLWAGQILTSSGTQPQTMFVFPTNLPTCATSGKNILIATQGFLDLGLVAPDYVIPNNFVQTPGGTLNFAGVSQVTYAALPNDGVHAIDHNGNTIPNLATNLAGASASVVPASPPAARNYQGLWWAAPAGVESGWGVNVAHQGDTIFVTWFTYDTTGKQWWLSMTANKTASDPDTYSGQLIQTHGPAFSAVPFDPAQVTTSVVGSGTLTFTDANNGSFAYSVTTTSTGQGQTVVQQNKAITRQVFGTVPTCGFAAQANPVAATNYTDLWWAMPAGVEAGWGINFTHQGTTIFATWFTYDSNGSPLWLSATLQKGTGEVFSGNLIQTAGPAFSAVLFDPTKVTLTVVGTASLTFSDGNTASFDYTAQSVTQHKAITRQLFYPPAGTVCH